MLRDTTSKWPTSLSPDGDFVIYHTDDGLASSSRYDLFVLPITGDRKPIPFLRTPFNEYVGQFSPDGRWVAYVSNESGRTELYVTAFPKPVGKWQVSLAGSTPQHRWGRDGKEMFYISPEGRMMAADIDGTGSSFVVGAVKPLFNVGWTGQRMAFDVSADGRRFLINTPAGDETATAPMTAVVNWSARLRR